MSLKRANSSLQPVVDIVHTGDVAKLAARADRLDSLGALLKRVLSPALADQVRLANVRDGKLVFLATSPAWATRLRYSQPVVLEAARQLGLDAREIFIKVTPIPVATVPESASRPLSETAARHLALAARLLR